MTVRSDAAHLAAKLRGSLAKGAAEIVSRFEALEAVLGSDVAATADAVANSVMARDGSADTAVRRLHATDAVDFTDDAAVAPVDQDAAATAGFTQSIRAGKGLGAAGGKLTIGGGDGGTPGTDLAGGTDIQLGAVAGNLSALLRVIMDSTLLASLRQTGAGTMSLTLDLAIATISGAGLLFLNGASSCRLMVASVAQVIVGASGANAVILGNANTDVTSITGPFRLTPIAAASVANPTAGSYSYFANASNSDKFSRKDSSGTVTVVGAET